MTDQSETRTGHNSSESDRPYCHGPMEYHDTAIPTWECPLASCTNYQLTNGMTFIETINRLQQPESDQDVR